MKCFICEKNEKEVMLVSVPCDVSYDGISLEILGNVQPNEFICLPCIGFQWDEIERAKAV